jgi:hypothetical protein
VIIMTRSVVSGKTLAQPIASVVGAVFLLVGTLGFVPGITTGHQDLAIAGHESHAMLLGVFAVSALHNAVHLLFGIAGLVMARTPAGARAFLIGGGAIYIVLWLYGLVIDQASAVNFVPVNTADNWLHFVLGVGMIALGLITSRRTAPSTHWLRGQRG